MEGEYHFDTTPIAPPGSEMLVHKNPTAENHGDSMLRKLGI